MVDRVNDINISRLVTKTDEAGDAPGDPQDDPMSEVSRQIREMAQTKHGKWNKGMIRNLQKATQNVIKKSVSEAAALNRLDEYAVMSASTTVRNQIRKMISHLNPPPEILEGAEFQELMEMIWPSAVKREKNAFKRGSAMRGQVKSEMMQQQVKSALDKASRQAGKKSLANMQMGSGNLGGFSQMAFEQMARALKRAMKKKKAKFDENGNLAIDEAAGLSEAEELEALRELQEMMQIFNSRALETMKSIREEFAPKWAPEQQPWLTQEADRQVYEIILAVIPKELFEETAAFQEIQDLRKGQHVFTLRAADKLTEAARRGS